ncbi:MarR family winged helix-turn-helix transcriptional regulator [Roseateles amylovorans]|uniref:MarR family transcriptional regulator n=1 Tax=Roseateles amylovorans TaxID=2978473 RepID=A0ABY6B0Z3_9BURK|nr:MarR family transcriptional regulator [Roseateles amylovorans]UXH79066.1 MarR family transcriptional regulator [Roseateles amylovorans]
MSEERQAIETSGAVGCDGSVILEEQLCFSLYTSALAMMQVYKPMLERIGLTYPQFLVMTSLWQSDGVTVKQLAERLRQDSGSLTPLVKRLEVAGYLQRARDRRDERNLCITLTAEGRALQAKGRAVSQQFAKACELPTDQSTQLRDGLTALDARLRGRHR